MSPVNSIPHPEADRNPLLSAALGYSQRYAWRVFPVFDAVDGHCTCDYPPDKCSPGKHPILAHGFREASADLEQVNFWWRVLYPQANIGAPTGMQSGFVVLDVDVKSGGHHSLAALETAHGAIDTLTAITGGGGKHYYFIPPDVPLKNSASEIGPGIDTRAEGGYILLPPSSHVSGNSYRWDNKRSMVPVPDWLLTLWPQQSLAGSQQAAPAILGDIVDGHRNATLTSWAGSMRKRGLSEGAILAALCHENESRCKPPMPEAIVRAIAAGMNRYPLGQPALFNPKAPGGRHKKVYLRRVEA
jgi:putative DNA primase/helicase